MRPRQADSGYYTLTARTSSTGLRSRGNSSPGASAAPRLWMDDARFRFQPDDALPKPRDSVGGPKRYRAGRVSSVPIDLKAFE